ncbi:amino acid ABC transporter substrate-binding protein [Rhodoligotrophos defluvii]|uniref:amino acid ABC transporter substrate-binding protein n=1 Tax=Rhodoligotrophos defluvii TaxID=2561934 RepID=UPI00195FE8D1|nr:amino acid ABC transporter substrate-binding protein [Rhodoligotrophos defluvii]
MSIRIPNILGGLALGGLLMAVFPATPNAGELSGTLKKIADTGTIAIGHREASIPFSYVTDDGEVVGYAYELCRLVADKIKARFDLEPLKITTVPVAGSARIPLLLNGTIDLECSSTTNNLRRQEQVAFTMTHFVAAIRVAAKKDSDVRQLADLAGKRVAAVAGSTTISLLQALNAERNLNLEIVQGKDIAETFLLLETDRVAGMVIDDILAASSIANSRNPDGYIISEEALSVEPYAIMLRRDDPQFKAAVDAAMLEIITSGKMESLYNKWFMEPIPPRGIVLNLPISSGMRKALAQPSDTADPAYYK